MREPKIPLPKNETALENAFAFLADRLFDIQNPTRLMTDPYQCPAEFLPYLAWARSVDIWDPAWSEIEKRREIAASPALHRLKGTRAALETSLARMGLEFEVTEWWEVAPEATRGTFKVLIDAQDAPTRSVRSEALARIKSTKPKSRVVNLKVGVSETGPLGIAAATMTRSLVVSENYVLDGVLEETGPLGLAAATLTRSIITSEAA